MARLARIVVPEIPHHVTQRGNRRQQVFFHDDDYAAYRALLEESCRAAGVAVWGYCLMPNHMHLILTPSTAAAAALRSAPMHPMHLPSASNVYRARIWDFDATRL